MDLLSQAIKLICEFLNSSFVIAFVGGLVGALGGALGAQHIIERSNRRSEIVRELRSTNAGIMVSFSIVTAALALKKQHVRPMYEKFNAHKAEFELFKQAHLAGRIPRNTQFPFLADLNSFPAPLAPIDTLKDLVFEKVTAQGRALALVSVIEQTLVGLRDSVAHRERLIEKFKSGDIPNEHVPYYYFGLPLQGGTNREYPDLIQVIHEYLDDLAFFSMLLCEDLAAHGNSIRSVFSKKYGKGAPKVSSVDFSSPKKAGLIPAEELYSDWLKGFAHQGKA